MSVSEKKNPEFYQEFMDAAMRVHTVECSGTPYSETPECKRLERLLIEMCRYKRMEKN